MSLMLISLTEEKSFPLNRPSIFIGRDRWRVDVRLPGDAVDEVHCELIQHGTGYRLINLGASGTLVNGQPVDVAVVQDGDELTIASHRLRLSCSEKSLAAWSKPQSDSAAEAAWATISRPTAETPAPATEEEPAEREASVPTPTQDGPELWRIKLAGLELGPMPWEELHEMVQTGQAHPTDPVCSTKSPEWQPFSAVPETQLAEVEPPSPIRTEEQSAPAPSLLPPGEKVAEGRMREPEEDTQRAEATSDLPLTRPAGTLSPDGRGDESDPQFFVMLGESETGPVPLETLQQLALEFRLTGTTLVRSEDEADWTPAGALDIDIPPPPETPDEGATEEETKPRREEPPATPLQRVRARLTWLLFSPVYYLANAVRAVLSLSPKTIAISGVATVAIGTVLFLWIRGWNQTALTGTITLDGEPLPAVLVTLTGMSTGDSAVGVTDSSGRFSARTLDGDLLPGRYHVTVTEPPDANTGQPKDDQGHSRIPIKFGSLGTTDMIIEVSPDTSDYEIPLSARLSGTIFSAER